MYKIIDEYSVSELNKKNFRVPLYQRKYSWSIDEVDTLLNDLRNAKDKGLDTYFLGNIVVEEKSNGTLDVIDGQQRFTTLFLMSKVAGVECFNLNYEIREFDQNFLSNLTTLNINSINYSNVDIRFKDNLNCINDFANKYNDFKTLISLCRVTLTKLPKDTDIVKYFEVMNNRGKQLEKHQVLKAKFLHKINDNPDNVDYSKIWDYCSNMDVYIEDSIYFGDLKSNEKDIHNKARKPLFEFIQNSKNIPEIFCLSDSNTFENKDFTINNLISNEDMNVNYNENFYIQKEYRSILKFPIFLIHVLKLWMKDNDNIDKYIVNDRYLIEYFYKDNQFIFDSEKSKKFILFLLKMRILFDYFIFKRDDKDEPFFDEVNFFEGSYNLKEEADNKILMIQLLFNFTSAQFFNQDWVSAILSWLNINISNSKDNTFYEKYLNFLESFDRDLSKIRLTKNLKINEYIDKKILDYKYKVKTYDVSDFDSILNNGTSTTHYWFYKLDYLLWKNSFYWKNNSFNNIERKKFRLSRLNSIEHIHPQNKSDEWQNANIDCFGNLALISNHMNSSLSDQDPNQKRYDINKQIQRGTLESLKMILTYYKYENWTEENCLFHQNEMIDLLKKDLENESF